MTGLEEGLEGGREGGGGGREGVPELLGGHVAVVSDDLADML